MTKITLKGNPCHTSGKLPSIGSTAPDFLLVNKDLSNCSFGDFSGKKKILCIVPSLDTGVCSTMAQTCSQMSKQKKGVAILVISADLPFAQSRFCTGKETENTTFLSMMRSKQFAKDYGVLLEDGPLAGICARALLTLDEKNKVLYAELVSEITHEPDYIKAFSFV